MSMVFVGLSKVCMNINKSVYVCARVCVEGMGWVGCVGVVLCDYLEIN